MAMEATEDEENAPVQEANMPASPHQDNPAQPENGEANRPQPLRRMDTQQRILEAQRRLQERQGRIEEEERRLQEQERRAQETEERRLQEQ